MYKARKICLKTKESSTLDTGIMKLPAGRECGLCEVSKKGVVTGQVLASFCKIPPMAKKY